MASALSEAEGDVLNTMKDFVLGFNKKLGDIREVLSETISEAWDSENELLGLNLEPFDTAHITNLIHTENIPFNKVVKVFGVLVTEMKNLKQIAETKFYGPLSMFGHSIDVQDEPDADKSDQKAFATYKRRKILPIEQQMGQFLPVLQDLSNFTKRVNAVIRNCIGQLACLYHERMKMWITTFKNVEFDYVFEALGELCTVLTTIDTIISDNGELQDGWVAYKRMMKYVRSDPERYNAEDEQLGIMEQLLMGIDGKVMSNTTLNSMLNQDFSLPESGPSSSPPPAPTAASAAIVSGNRVLSQAFGEVISRLYLRLKAGLNEPMETYERVKFVDLFGLYSLYRALFKTTIKVDMKLFKTLWELQTKIPLVPLFGRSSWMIADYMVKYCPASDNSSLKPQPKYVIQTRRDILTELDNTFHQRTQQFYTQMCVWMVRMEGELIANQDHNAGALLNARAKLLLHGVLLANQIKCLVMTSIHLRLSLGVGFQSRNVRALATCLELLKAIEHTYRRRLSMLSDNMQHMLAQTTFTLKKILIPLKQKLERRDPSTSKLNDTKADVFAAISLALDLMDLPPTASRRALLQLCLCVSQIKHLLKSNFEEEVRYQIWKLERLSNYQVLLRNACDCSFLYWVSNVVPVVMKDITENQVDQANRLQYLFIALRDCSNMLKATAITPESGKVLVDVYQAEVRAHFQSAVVRPIVRQVETDLRLHIHSVVLQQANLRNQSRDRDLTFILNMKPLRVFDELIVIRDHVAHHLDSTFYNHNTVALHDGKIYSDMRNLAEAKYGLTMTDCHLPGSAHYSESLDVLEIMRNIHVFVARYNYNLNTQIFIERAVDQKHLNVIDVEHIATSIRTHGTGIMNTTVNFTYQFLCRKFVLISEFLFDDHIKSPLIREVRGFKQRKDELRNMYPYDHADKFVKDIRKLGMSETGLTYLDQLRLQLTEIGNALGYVRMVRSGGLHHGSQAVQFVPEIDNINLFKPLAQQSQLSPDTIVAADNLDLIIDDLTKNVAEGTEYFLVLVKIFADAFSTDEHAHIRNFFAIIPALTINFVETMLQKKEKLHKRSGRSEASFTDDGFVLGIAYLLKLFEQDAEFDAWHWFDSVSAHFRKQKSTLEGQIQQAIKSRNKSFDVEHSQLTIKRLDAVMVEFELLSYSLTGARIFFRDMTTETSQSSADAAASTANSGSATASAEPNTPAAAAPPAPALTDIPDAPDLGFFF